MNLRDCGDIFSVLNAQYPDNFLDLPIPYNSPIHSKMGPFIIDSPCIILPHEYIHHHTKIKLSACARFRKDFPKEFPEGISAAIILVNTFVIYGIAINFRGHNYHSLPLRRQKMNLVNKKAVGGIEIRWKFMVYVAGTGTSHLFLHLIYIIFLIV